MSSSVDERVVKMKLDKESFVNGVGSVLTALASLKKGMDMSSAANSFNQLDKAANSVSFDGLTSKTNLLGEGISGVSSKFSALEVAAVTTVVNITNAIENKLMVAVNQLSAGIKSLSVDQIAAGWEKYADKTTSVQTIMSATTSTWEENANNVSLTDYLKQTAEYGNLSAEALSSMAEMYQNVTSETMTAKEAQKAYNLSAEEYSGIMNTLANATGYEGTQMDFVNDQLNKLNWFTDETSYNLTDMTSNIGKFTSAGVSLSDSVQAMEGISVWASKSGQGVNEASRAMYNLSQAMATGVVKKEDWKSIENANMATIEFKTTALETAESLGYLKKTAEGTWETTAKAAKSGIEVTAETFASELTESQWFTSDVLLGTLNTYGNFTQRLSDIMADERFEAIDTTSEFISMIDTYSEATDKEKALADMSEETGIEMSLLRKTMEELSSEEYELGRSSFKAAQEAKTFQEAIDATKDAVSTGWLNSFEIVFGNYEEAKVLWTDLANDLWDIFASSAEERNDFLTELMQDLGGRDVLLESYANVMEGLKEIIQEVKNIFNEVFPKKTAEEALTFLETIRNLTSKLIILNDEGEVSSVWMRRLKIVLTGTLTLIKNVGSIFSNLIGIVKNLATDAGVLWRKLLPDSSVSGTLTNLFSSVNNGATKIGDLTAKLKEFLDPAKVATAIGKDAYGIVERLKKVIDFLRGGFDSIKTAISDFVQGMKDSNDTAEESEDRFGHLKGLLDGLKTFFEGLWNILKQLAPVLDKVAGFIGDMFSQLGNGLKEAVSSGDFSVLTDLLSVGVMGGIFALLKKVPDVLEGLTDALNSMTANVSAETVLTIAKAVGILAASALVLSLIDSDRLLGSVSAIAGLVAELAVVLDVLGNTFSSSGKGPMAALNTLAQGKMLSQAAGSLTKLAASVLILAVAMKIISSIDPDACAASLLVITALVTELTGVAILLGKQSGNMKKGTTSFIAMGLGVIAMAAALKIVASIDADAVWRALGVISIVLTEMTVAVAALKAIGGIGGGGALLAASIGLIAIAGAFKIFASIGDDTSLGRYVGTIAAVLGILAVGLNLMNSTLTGSAALLIASVSLIALATAMKIFTSIDKKMGTAVGTIAALLGILAVGLTAMIAALPGAVALITFAGALYVLIPALLALAAIDGGKLKVALQRIVVILLAIGAASLLLLPGAVALTVFAVALTVVAVAVTVISAALIGLTTAITVLNAIGTAGIISFVGMLKTLIKSFNVLIPSIIELIANVVSGILTMLITVVPQFLELVSVTIVGILQVVQAAIPEFCNTLVVLVESLLATAETLIPEIAAAGVTIVSSTIIAVLNALSEAIPDMIAAGFQLVLSVINGLAEAVETYAPQINNAVKRLGKAILDAFLDFWGIGKDKVSVMKQKAHTILTDFLTGLKEKAEELWEDLKSIGGYLMEGLKEGIEKAKQKVIDAASKVFTVIKNAAQNSLDIHSPSRFTMWLGENFDKGFVKGVEGYEDSTVDSVTSLGSGVMSAMTKIIGSIQEAMDEDIDCTPQIKPVLDLSEIQNGGDAISGLLNDGISVTAKTAQKAGISLASSGNSGSSNSSPSFNFTQNNYSPKSLSATEIYRQTRSQFAQMKGVVNAI